MAMIVLALSFILLLVAPAGAQSLAIVDYLPGSVADAEAADDHVFCSVRSGLLVLDAESLEQTAFLPLPNAGVLTVVDGLAYVSGVGGDGLRVVDVSVPASPVLLGSCESYVHASDMDVMSGYLYVTERYPGRLHVFDVRDPHQPGAVSQVYVPDEAHSVAARDGLLYVAAESAGLRIYDAVNPMVLTPIGSCDVPWSCRGVALEGDLAALSTGTTSVVQLVDVSSPTEPVYLGYLSGSYDDTKELVLADGLVYLPVDEVGLKIGDVSNPLDPVWLGTCSFDGASATVALLDDVAYVSTGYRGLSAVDVSDPAAPMLAGRCATVGDAADIHVGGVHVLVAGGHCTDGALRDGVAELVTVDLAAPRIIDTLPMSLPLVGVAADGELACTLDIYAHLNVVGLPDPSGPAAPELLGTLDLPGDGADVAMVGTLAYAACGPEGLRIVDLADPANPVELGFVTVYESVSGVVVRGDYAYITEYYSGLYTVDVSDPTTPIISSFVITPTYCHGLAEDNGHLFVATNNGGLQIFSLDDPSHPQLVSGDSGMIYTTSVAAAWPLVAVASFYHGVTMFDVSEPSIPVVVGTCPEAVDVRAMDFDAEGRLVAVAHNDGLFVLDLETSVAAPAPAASTSLEIAGPNPFNPRTAVAFSLAVPGPVTLRIYDPSGRLVRTLAGGETLSTGRHSFHWDGRDDGGRISPAGVYLCRLATDHVQEVRKLTLVK